MSNGGTWWSSATLIAARHRVGILSDSRSSVLVVEAALAGRRELDPCRTPVLGIGHWIKLHCHS